MTRQWHVVSLEEAKLHPLYGFKGWLAFFAFGVLFGALRGLEIIPQILKESANQAQR